MYLNCNLRNERNSCWYRSIFDIANVARTELKIDPPYKWNGNRASSTDKFSLLSPSLFTRLIRSGAAAESAAMYSYAERNKKATSQATMTIDSTNIYRSENTGEKSAKIEGKKRKRQKEILVFFQSFAMPTSALSPSEILRWTGIARSFPPLNRDAVVRGTFET